jgi:DNA polymerase-3 subunit epsilon
MRPVLETLRRSRSFVAIDFETADRFPDSACSVAVVRVEHGEVTRTMSLLLRPPRRRFRFSRLHGIRWEDVRRAPSFLEAWPPFVPLFEGVDVCWAHNATFDRSVLRACCAAARLSEPAVEWNCTVDLARRVWGFEPANLAHVSREMGIPLRHHDAASDAAACAQIVLRAQALFGPTGRGA